MIGPSAIRPAPSHYVTCAAHLTLTEPPIRAATWIARVTVVTAPERLFGSRPGENNLAGHASIAAALRFHAAAQIAHCERS